MADTDIPDKYEVVGELDVEEIDSQSPDPPWIRTLKAQNNLGKIVYSIAGIAGIGAPLTYLNGGNMEIFNELLVGDQLDVILGIIILVLMAAAVFLDGKRKEIALRLKDAVAELKVGKEMFEEFKKEESQDGKEFSREELRQLAMQLGAIITVLFNKHKENEPEY